MDEYRLIYQWDTDHWTRICDGNIKDIYRFICLNKADMEDALEENEDALYTIEYCKDNAPVAKWEGTPTELLDIILELDS